MLKKAMILAAGFGTRLKPLTDNLPKALVPFGKGTVISYQIEKLKSLGINEIIVNAHHYSDLILKYFQENDFGVKINIIVEEEILGTGGGILNAKEYFSSQESFLVVNVDVFTNMDYSLILKEYDKLKPLALLAVQKRKTSRYLEFDDRFNLIMRIKSDTMNDNCFAFNGLHIISNRIFESGFRTEFSDILDIYLSLIIEGYEIKGFNSGDSFFLDIGKIDNLKLAESLSD